MITVVIPYFQRQAGILRRALTSVAGQVGCPLPVHILVVDDESPIPAQGEVTGIAWPQGFTVSVVRQANAGPGDARNKGLDLAPPETGFIAFLDSDDEWNPDHLEHAIRLLEAGFDFYFSDHLQLQQTQGAFARAKRLDMSRHQRVDIASGWGYAYQGDFLDQVLRGNVVGTSTVVYRRSGFDDVRFRTDLTTAGEDYLFWMAMAKRGARVCFSDQVEVVYGKGVNVFAGSGWGTDGHMQRLHDEIAFKKSVRQEFPLTPLQSEHVASSLQSLRLAFARDLLHRLGHRKRLSWPLLRRHARLDPLSYLLLPISILRIVTGRA